MSDFLVNRFTVNRVASIGTLREVDPAGEMGSYRLPPDSPIRRLIIAVLMVAIEDARTGGSRTGCSTDKDGLAAKRRRMMQAREWILDDYEGELYSFNRLCEELEMDPGSVKRAEQAKWTVVPEECVQGKKRRMVHSVTRKMGA